MINFEYNGIMKRYDVKVPFVLAEGQDMVTVASISEDKEAKVTLHRGISLRLLKQIILQWDEYEHQMSREFDELLDEDKPDESQLRVIDGANKKKGNK